MIINKSNKIFIDLEIELFLLKNKLFSIYRDNLFYFIKKLEKLGMHKEMIDIYRILRREQKLSIEASQQINEILKLNLSNEEEKE